ncbi:hypothetical protein CAPTEDRAFT_79233, partial [Capitella teleta]
CENSWFNISCPLGSQLKLATIQWGRTTGRSVCPHPAARNVNCISTYAPDVIRRQCEGHQTCLLKATNRNLKDACPGIYKYLNVTHTC